MNFLINDVIKLNVNIPEEKLVEGQVGVVVAVFSDPREAYEIEFCNDDRGIVMQLALLPEQISKLT